MIDRVRFEQIKHDVESEDYFDEYAGVLEDSLWLIGTVEALTQILREQTTALEAIAKIGATVWAALPVPPSARPEERARE